MTTVAIYCNGTNEKNRHAWCPIARYDRPHMQGDELIDTWGPVRAWPGEGGTTAMLPEFERWVTDDDDEAAAGTLSLTDQRRLFRYRCALCEFDYQRVGRMRHGGPAIDAWAARDSTLGIVAFKPLAYRGIGEIAGIGKVVPVREFVKIWEQFLAGETPR